MYESAIGTTTARPPWSPVELGLLAGRDLTPARRGSIHWRHEEAGATIQWAGPWKRPYAYGEHPEDEVRAVHESLGVIDVSTLGKLLVEGPEAVQLLERLYPNRFGDMKPGRIRYGVLTVGRRPDHGRRHDRPARRRPLLRDDDVDRSRLGHGLVRMVERGVGLRRGDRERDGRSRSREPRGAALARRVAAVDRGRRLRGRLQVSRRARDRGRGCADAGAAHRLRRRARLRAPLPEPGGRAPLGRARRGGARPFGLEPQRVLRLEKGHVIVGQDTDSESNLYSPGCPGFRRWTRTTSSASSRSSTSRSARRRRSSSASRWRRTCFRPRGRRS